MIFQLINSVLIKTRCKKKNTKIYTRIVPKDLIIGKYCIIGKKTFISDNVIIGDFTYLNSNALEIIIESNVNIGNYCSIGPGVIIGLGNHYIDTVTTHPILFNKYYNKAFNSVTLKQKLEGLADKDKKTIIGSDVWIGARANIKRGVCIGNGAIIASDSVVTRDVPEYAIVAGIPAKIIKYRFDEKYINIMKKNTNFCFWKWDDDFMAENFESLYDIEKYTQILTNKTKKD